MARITKPLTNTEVKQAKPKAKEYNLADGGGLSLRVKATGHKLWLFNYQRPFTKKRANLSLGTFPEVPLAKAREKAKDARALLLDNIDPQEHRNEHALTEQAALSNTLEHIAAEWFEVKKTTVSQNYAADIWRSLELHLFPDLGKLPIHKLTAPKTITVIKPIAAKGSLETVKRLCQRLNEIMVYTVNTGVLSANPLAGIAKAFETPEKTHMPTLRPEQLPELMQTLHKASIKRTTRCLIEWQLHTMVRPSEAAGAMWSEIDTPNKLWHIPAERMKKKRPHSVPLTDHTLALLEAMKPYSGHRDYIFPADRSPRKPISSQTANMALKRMGFGGVLVAHGMRALASTTLNEQGFDPEIIEAALAHVDANEVRKAYNRAEYIEKRRPLMAWWSGHIEKAATGNLSMANTGNVLTGTFA